MNFWTNRRSHHRTALSSGLVLALAVFASHSVNAAGFERSLELQGVRFHVTCPNEGSINTLKIQPTGLSRATKPIVVEIEGTVAGAEVADLNADGSPEIYVYITSAGSGSYGSLVAYAANRKKSLTPIMLPDLLRDKRNSQGYMGHDEFTVGEGALLRRFPVYKPGDSNAKPSGGTRQLQYKLKAGEAGWKFLLDRVEHY